VFATLPSRAIVTAAEPTIPRLPIAAIDAGHLHGLSVRCRHGTQDATSGAASLRADDDCGTERAEKQLLSRTAASDDVYANRTMFNLLISSRSS
jgi:hypothetical protein